MINYDIIEPEDRDAVRRLVELAAKYGFKVEHRGTCENCGAKFALVTRKPRRFCSRPCQYLAMQKRKHAAG